MLQANFLYELYSSIENSLATLYVTATVITTAAINATFTATVITTATVYATVIATFTLAIGTSQKLTFLLATVTTHYNDY